MRQASSLEVQARQLELTERDVLRLLGTGCSTRTIGRQLALTDATVSAHLREIRRKLAIHSVDALKEYAVSLRDVIAVDAASLAMVHPQHFPHQSRWLPDLRLSADGPVTSLCRRGFHCQSLRDVGDFLRECAMRPGPAPDDLLAIVRHRTGTIGAKQALLAALAREGGRKDVQLMVACYELPLAGDAGRDRPMTLPLAICYLRCGPRDVQIAAPGEGSLLLDRSLSVECVSPERLAEVRMDLYKKMAVDWCRALDIKPNDFARLRAEQLRKAERPAVFEDLLGHSLPADYLPIT